MITISLSIPNIAFSCLPAASLILFLEAISKACLGMILTAAKVPFLLCFAILTLPILHQPNPLPRGEKGHTTCTLPDSFTYTPRTDNLRITRMVRCALPTGCCCFFLESSLSLLMCPSSGWGGCRWKISRSILGCVGDRWMRHRTSVV
jgi:hypothetical protein